MTTRLAEWASELSQVTEIRPSDASVEKIFQRPCNWGTVRTDLAVKWKMPDYDPDFKRTDFAHIANALADL